MSVPSSEFGPSPPLPQASVSLPPEPNGGGGGNVGEGVRGPNSDDWRKSQAVRYTLYPFAMRWKKNTNYQPMKSYYLQFLSLFYRYLFFLSSFLREPTRRPSWGRPTSGGWTPRRGLRRAGWWAWSGPPTLTPRPSSTPSGTTTTHQVGPRLFIYIFSLFSHVFIIISRTHHSF